MTTVTEFAKLSALVIDDASHMRSILRGILVGLGFRRIYEAADGADGLERLSTVSPDIVFIDWEMPVLSGPETIQMIRRHEDKRIATTPIILLTGHTDKARVQQAKTLGIDAFLAKPVSAALIRDRVRAILHMRQQRLVV